ncbi:MAG: MMPL family transporter [Spirochaetota bacterium]
MHRLLRFPRLIVTAILAVTVFFAFHLPDAELDNNVFSFVPDDHPDNLAMDEVEEVFGTTVPMAVGIEFPRGSIFDPAAVRLVSELTEVFEELDNVGEVTSLSNMDYIEGSDEGMEVMPLLSGFQGTEEEIREVKNRLLSWEIYDNFLYSDDFRASQILIGVDLDIGADRREQLYFDVKDVLADYEAPDVNFYLAGEPVISVLLSTNMRSDLATLIPLVLLVVLVVLYAFFRRLGGVLLPTITVVVSAVWTIGAMALLGVSLSLVATVIPVLLVAVGSAYGIHVVNHFYEELPSQEPREAVSRSLKAVGRPVLLAGVTTIIGFGALATSEVEPMRSFGVFTAIGVAVALLVALTLIPALLILRPPKIGGMPKTPSGLPEERARRFAALLTRRRGTILAATLLVAVVAAWGASRLVVDNELIGYFTPESEIQVSDRFLRERFGGTRTFDIEVAGDKDGALTDPEVLLAMDRMARYLTDRYPLEIARIVGYPTFVKRMNQVMHVGAPPPATGREDTASAAAGRRTAAPTAPSSPDSSPGASSDTTSSGELPSFFSGVNEPGAEEPGTEEAPAPELPPDVDTAPRDGVAALLSEALGGADRADVSARELVSLVHRETNYQGAAYYEIPSDPRRYRLETADELSNLVSQYLLVYSGSLEEWADDPLEPRKGRMLVQLGTTGNLFTEELVKEIDDYAEAEFPPGYRVRSAGFSIVEMAITRLISRAQVHSIVVSLTLVFFVVALTFRSLVAGFFGIVPIGITILINFGVMGFAGINLDVSTAMVASIAIGIGIDYTIHFLSSYHRERKGSADAEETAVRVLSTTGKAIFFNAGSVAAGFAVLLLSNFVPLRYLGLLIALTMVVSSVAAVTILPVLLEVINPRFMKSDS